MTQIIEADVNSDIFMLVIKGQYQGDKIMFRKKIVTLVCLLFLTPFFLFLSSCGDSDSSSKGSRCGTVIDIGSGSTLNGVLEAGDCRISDLDPTSSDSSFADEYLLTLSSPATMTITMRSNTLDSYLLLLGRSSTCASGCTAAEANVLAVDDDSGFGVTGLDAQINITLNAGSYIIVANSFDLETGSYTLETSF